MKSTFLISFLFFAAVSFAQAKKIPDVFEPAYIITLKGDTVRGAIKMPKTNKIEIYQKITFRDKANKQRLYYPGKIKGYGLEKYFYMTGFHNMKPCFFKVLSAGKFTLLQMLYEEMVGGEKVIVQEFCVMSGEQGEEFVVLEEKGLKKQLKDFFKPNKPMIQKLNEQKTVEYEANILEAYFNEFNESAK